MPRLPGAIMNWPSEIALGDYDEHLVISILKGSSSLPPI